MIKTGAERSIEGLHDPRTVFDSRTTGSGHRPRAGTERPVAFCQYVPGTGHRRLYSLDLMRRDDGGQPNG